jgi:hypothetical protein
MKPQDQRKFLQQLRALCRQNSVELIEEDKPGSHKGLIIRDDKTGESVTLVIADRREVSPGVQRQILKYLGKQAARLAIAETVREIFEEIVKGDGN